MEENKTTSPSSKQKNWVRRHPYFIFSTLIVLLSLFFTNNSHNQSSSQVQNTDSDMLKAKIQADPYNLYITNLEGGNWTDCMLGLNGSDGFNFENPPYQTHNNFTVYPGKRLSVPLSTITLEDGTQFDPSTHAMNSIVLVCFRHSQTRVWVGH